MPPMRQHLHSSYSRRVWNDAIAPLVEAGRQRKRFQTRVAAKLGETLGTSICPQRIYAWLMAPADKRIVPSYGMGTLLLQVIREVLAEAEPNPSAEAAAQPVVDAQPQP